MNPTSLSFFDAPTLVADIGGTHCNFGLVMPGGQTVSYVRKLKVEQFLSPVHAVHAYLQLTASEARLDPSNVKHAAFAVATPLDGDEVNFTNSPWSFSIAKTKAALRLHDLKVINDFEALALSLPILQPNQYRAHGEPPLQAGLLAVVGAGTGLGVAAVKQCAGRWFAMASEGGHTSFAPGNAFERELLATLSATYEHVSAERLLSGIGLPTLYQSVAQVLGLNAEVRDTPSIVQTGLAKTDALSDRTLDVFCEMLGGFCGNVALTYGARSGVFVGGGIVPRLGERFFTSGFRQRFEAKGRFKEYLSNVPTALITDPYAALSGVALTFKPA